MHSKTVAEQAPTLMTDVLHRRIVETLGRDSMGTERLRDEYRKRFDAGIMLKKLSNALGVMRRRGWISADGRAGYAVTTNGWGAYFRGDNSEGKPCIPLRQFNHRKRAMVYQRPPR